MTVQSTKTVELESGTPIPKFPTHLVLKKLLKDPLCKIETSRFHKEFTDLTAGAERLLNSCILTTILKG